MLKSIFFPLIFSTSISVQTPNIHPNPVDYHIAFQIQKRGAYSLMYALERQNGIEYIDEEYWIRKTFRALKLGEKYETALALKYLDNQTADIRYLQVDYRLYYLENFNIGHLWQFSPHAVEISHYNDFMDWFFNHCNIVIGFSMINYDVNLFLFEFKFSNRLDLITNFKRINISTNSSIEFDVLQNMSIGGLLRSEKFDDKIFYQMKITASLKMK